LLSIPEELKQIYKSDRVPIVRRLALKELTLFFPELELTIGTDRIVDDTFELQENLCSTDDITLGACEGAIIKLTVANLVQDLSGYEFVLTQTIDGIYTMPLGTYRIESCKKQNDLWFREIVAYNSMTKTNIDVSDWYNSLVWPQTVKSMRESLLAYLGLEFEEQTVTNDTVTLEKTVSPSGLVGNDILSRLCEINAGFGHITRENKFKVVQLSGLGLYPSETLYPAEDLFPSESGEYITAGYESTEYEEYIVEPITSMTIREDDEDFGTTAGVEGNPYIIEGNYLLFGKASTEMQTIADNILLQVKNKFYRPHNTVMIGLPYMEVGDSVNIMTDGDAVESFIFRRTLKGIQSLTDEISATGNRRRSQQVGLNTQIKQLKGKTLVIKQTIDELSSTMRDEDENLQSQITQQAGQIELRVEKSGVIAAINVTSESIKISASKLELSGYATFTSLSTPGESIIDGANFKTGTVTADTVRSTWVYAGNINANQITAGTISGISIIGPSANFASITIQGTSSTTEIFGGSVTCNTINGGTPITTSNRTNYTYPPSSHTHNSNTINPVLTTGGNVGLDGINVASVNWVNNNFQPLSSSDFRLKKNFKPLSELPLTLFMELKAKQFEYKSDVFGKGIRFGFNAQQIEKAFQRHGYSPYEYNLIELRPVKNYTQEGIYIKDYVHRINYENFHAWEIDILQRICKKINLS